VKGGPCIGVIFSAWKHQIDLLENSVMSDHSKDICVIYLYEIYSSFKWASFIVEGNFDCHWKGEGWIGSVNLALQQATYEPL
jgi:hypothetical protein